MTSFEKTISTRLDEMPKERSRTLTAFCVVVAILTACGIGFIATKGLANAAHEVVRAEAPA